MIFQPKDPATVAANPPRRLALLRIVAPWVAIQAGTPWLAGCGGGGAPAPEPTSPSPSPPPPPPPTPTPAMQRLRAALAAPAITPSPSPVTVTQGEAQSATSSFGNDAVFHPPFGSTDLSLATMPEVWGWRRDLWTVQSGARIAGTTVLPVSRDHPASTMGSQGICGLHFIFDGAAFEILFAGVGAQITLVADGHYMASQVITTNIAAGVQGASLSNPNALVRFDFGSAATRRISVYARSSQGPSAIVVPAGTQLQPWDRSAETSFAAVADSYGGAAGPNWGISGPFWEAAAQMGIANLDLDAIGGTGYAPNNASPDTRDPGNAFPARLPGSVASQPDLFISAGSINDNNSFAAPPLYASAAEAQAGFTTALATHFGRLRAALPGSVLVALGPWAPRQSIPTDPVAQSKSDQILAALRTVGHPWIFLDNLNGGWKNSSGASDPGSGPWQTGTGNVGAPNGSGNGDLYVDLDGVHPNVAGSLYLGTQIASGIKAALAAL